MVEPGTAISVLFRFYHLFYAFGTACFCVFLCVSFTGIERKLVARPVEGNLPLSTVSVCPSARTHRWTLVGCL